MSIDLIQYQNANQSFENIVDNFIVRKNEFERVMDDIRNTDKSSSFQHYLFVGRRGSGKSTLLRRIQAEIYIDIDLHIQYEVINLGEEQSFIYKIYDLWDYVTRELNDIGYNIQSLDFRAYKEDMKSYTKDLHAQIIQALRAKNKRLVLLLDNIDRILDTRNGNMDASLLRELLINFSDIRILGGSTVMSEHFWKYDKPFYQFFTIKRLESLSLEEVEQLLTHLSEAKNIPEILPLIKQHPGKLQSIRMLTDGMPRTMLLFVDMMLNRPEQNGYLYLQQLVDKATPIYQERLGLLSDAQRKILSELAFIWDGASVVDLIPRCNMEGKLISAILKQLVDIKYIEKIKTKNKNNLYRVEERFFNLWFNMTQGGLHNRARAKALTSFLENWYEISELNDLCKELSKLIKIGKAQKDYIEAMSQALLGSKMIDNNLKLELSVELKNNGFTIQGLDDRQQIKEINNSYENKDYKKVIELLENSRIELGIKYFNLGVASQDLSRETEAEGYYSLASKEGNIDASFNLANLLKNQGKEIEAEKYYIKAIEKGHKGALNNLAVIYYNQGKFLEAEKYYLLAIEKGHIGALNNIGNLYQYLGKESEAKKYYLIAIEAGHIGANHNLAIMYYNQGELLEAEKYFLQALEKGHNNTFSNLAILYEEQNKTVEAEKYYHLALENGNIDASINLANFYRKKGKYTEAEKYYLLAIENGHLDALNNLANIYLDQGKHEEAEKLYLIALEKGQIAALNNLALLLSMHGKLEEAEKYYLLAIENGNIAALFNLAVFYEDQKKYLEAEKYYLLAVKKGDIDALNNLGILYNDQMKFSEAEKYYLQAIEKDNIAALINLANLYSDQKKHVEAEIYYLQAIENGHVDALNNLAALYYSQNKKIETTELINKQTQILIGKFIDEYYEFAILLFLYIGNFTRFKALSDKYLCGEKQFSSLILERLLIHNQYNWVFKYFAANKVLVESYKPLYYATLHLLGDKDQEILKMPPELQENVANILTYINTQQKLYSS